MVSFAGLNRPVEKVSTSLLKSLESYISKDIPVNSSEYNFLKRNPLGYYLESGKEVNKFLRSGKFDNILIITDDVPEVLKPILQRQNEEKKELNRVILESIPILDSKFNSKTTEPMVVFRDAPPICAIFWPPSIASRSIAGRWLEILATILTTISSFSVPRTLSSSIRGATFRAFRQDNLILWRIGALLSP